MRYFILASTVAVLSTNLVSVLATPTRFLNSKRADAPCTAENVTFNFDTPPFLEFRNFTIVNATSFQPEVKPPSPPYVEYAPANATSLNETQISVPENETYTFDLYSFFIYANAPPTTEVLVSGYYPDNQVAPVIHQYTLGSGFNMMPINLTGVAGFTGLQKVIVKVEEFQSSSGVNGIPVPGSNTTINEPYLIDDFAIQKLCAQEPAVKPTRF